MKIKKNLQIINEGKTNILVYKNNKNEKGPGTKSDKPFYNPSMEMNRDLSIAINQWLIDNNKNEIQILDGLASTGIRGIRFANELTVFWMFEFPVYRNCGCFVHFITDNSTNSFFPEIPFHLLLD